jgi:hypothetical protein
VSRHEAAELGGDHEVAGLVQQFPVVERVGDRRGVSAGDGHDAFEKRTGKVPLPMDVDPITGEILVKQAEEDQPDRPSTNVREDGFDAVDAQGGFLFAGVDVGGDLVSGDDGDEVS